MLCCHLFSHFPFALLPPLKSVHTRIDVIFNYRTSEYRNNCLLTSASSKYVLLCRLVSQESELHLHSLSTYVPMFSQCSGSQSHCSEQRSMLLILANQITVNNKHNPKSISRKELLWQILTSLTENRERKGSWWKKIKGLKQCPLILPASSCRCRQFLMISNAGLQEGIQIGGHESSVLWNYGPLWMS